MNNRQLVTLTEGEGCDMIDGVREVPLRSLAPGRRFELILTATTPYPHKRVPGTVIRHGPGTSAVVLDHAEKERSFTTKEGTEVVLHTTGGVVYWSPGTPVVALGGTRDISRWTTKGGTGVGLTPEAESDDELKAKEKINMAQAKERYAALPIGGAAATRSDKRKGKAKLKVVKTRKAKTLNDCKCGCGEKVGGNFRQGHDARYYSILKKVKSGEMTFNQMPRLMQNEAKDTAGVKRILASSRH